MDGDRRAKRTERELKKAFLSLLAEKPIDKITIKDLTDRADINRGTFYLHYTDIYDLFSEIEKETINKVNEATEKHTPQELKKDIYPLIHDLFAGIDENREIFTMLFENNRNSDFSEKITNAIKIKCYYDWDAIFKDANKDNYGVYSSFIISGCIGLIRYWVMYGNESVDEISDMAKRLIISGVDIIKN